MTGVVASMVESGLTLTLLAVNNGKIRDIDMLKISVSDVK